MKISMDIIERSFRDHVVEKHILDSSQMSLCKCAFYDPLEEITEDTVYLCRDFRQLNPEKLPGNSSLIFADSISEAMFDQLKQINYLVITAIPMYKLFNQLLDVFYRYERYDEQFSQLIKQKCSYQELIDLSTKMLETPICMLNLNYQTIAISAMDISDDALWAAMKNGYGLGYYDFIQRCEFKTEEMSKNGISQKCSWSELSNTYLCVNVLYLNGRAVASMGIHKWYEKRKPFERSTRQLFNYVVRRVNERIQLLHDLPESRYTPTDMLLIELLDGKDVKKEITDKLLHSIGLPAAGTFHLAIFAPQQPLCRTEKLLDYMEMIEHSQPNMHCCIYKSTIIALHVIVPDQNSQLKKGLLEFLQSINYYCIYGLEFNDLMETHKAFRTLEILKNDVLRGEDLRDVCYAHNYLIEYAMTVLSKYMDISKLVHPSVKTLREYDERGKSNLYKVLRTFLYNKCCLKSTSDALFLHRNTLASRLSTIKEIIGINFEDEEAYKQMLFSIFCMDYCEKQQITDSSSQPDQKQA